MNQNLILLLLIVATATFAQEAEKKPTSISSEPKLLSIMLEIDNGGSVKINGTAIFTLTEANSDDTLTGALVYTISENDRQRLARTIKKSLSEIPENVTINDVIGGFEKKPSCPDLRIEFSGRDFVVAGLKARLDRFDLTFRETPQELSKQLCKWARSISVGRGPHRIPSAINRLLKGEKKEEQ